MTREDDIRLRALGDVVKAHLAKFDDKQRVDMAPVAAAIDRMSDLVEKLVKALAERPIEVKPNFTVPAPVVNVAAPVVNVPPVTIEASPPRKRKIVFDKDGNPTGYEEQ